MIQQLSSFAMGNTSNAQQRSRALLNFFRGHSYIEQPLFPEENVSAKTDVLENGLSDIADVLIVFPNPAKNYTKVGYEIVQRSEVIFSQTNEKNHCISGNMELFFEAGLRKKNEQLGLFHIPFWYYVSFRWKLPIEPQNATVKVFDLLGNQVTEFAALKIEDQKTIDIEKWGVGIYSYVLYSHGVKLGKGKFTVY